MSHRNKTRREHVSRAPAVNRHATASLSSGYSGTPLPRKLGIKPNSVVALIDAPDAFEQTLEELPLQVTLRRDLRASPGMALFFAADQRALARQLPRLASVLEAGGGAWVCWPKKGSGVVTDVTETVIRERVIATGLVDIKVCAIDATWSGLRIALRRA